MYADLLCCKMAFWPVALSFVRALILGVLTFDSVF